MTRGRSSVEQLKQFNCGGCKKWFSIGDPPADRTRWTCPWCGLQQEFDAAVPDDVIDIKTDTVDA